MGNSHQQLVVAESVGRMVIIMERDDKSVQTIECDKFKHPRGIPTGPVVQTGASMSLTLLHTVCSSLTRKDNSSRP